MLVLGAVEHAAGEWPRLVDRAEPGLPVEEPACVPIIRVVQYVADQFPHAAHVVIDRAAVFDLGLSRHIAEAHLDQQPLTAVSTAAGIADGVVVLDAQFAFVRFVLPVLVELVFVDQWNRLRRSPPWGNLFPSLSHGRGSMDPNRTWLEIAVAVEREEWERAAGLAQDLITWIDRGGFVPEVTGKLVFDRIIVYQTCDSLAAWEIA